MAFFRKLVSGVHRLIDSPVKGASTVSNFLNRHELAVMYRANKKLIKSPPRTERDRRKLLSDLSKRRHKLELEQSSLRGKYDQRHKVKWTFLAPKRDGEPRPSTWFEQKRIIWALAEYDDALRLVGEAILSLESLLVGEQPSPKEREESVFRDEDYETARPEQQPIFNEEDYESRWQEKERSKWDADTPHLDKRTISCLNPACGRPLLVPVDQGALRVTCPTCRHKFDWPPRSR